MQVVQVPASAIVGEVETGFLGGFEDVLVFGTLDGYAALLEGYFVGLSPCISPYS